MEHRSGEQSLKERIRSGHIRREDVTRRLAESGGTACEDAALQAAHALGQIGAAYQIHNAEFDGKSGLFGITVLVTFSRVYDPIE